MRKTKKNRTEPSSVDDLFVNTERYDDPDYMMHDPRFNPKAMEKRSQKKTVELKKRFEEKYSVK